MLTLLQFLYSILYQIVHKLFTIFNRPVARLRKWTFWTLLLHKKQTNIFAHFVAKSGPFGPNLLIKPHF